mmetsp:Transcript_19774/g.33073  ORF Transcript_19774/g.33073 Transcript_19774/m.33073 type:complete len:232 (-) Transcript_19774:706-1401(-)
MAAARMILTVSERDVQVVPFTSTMTSPTWMGGSHIAAGLTASGGNSLKRRTCPIPDLLFPRSSPIPSSPLCTVVAILMILLLLLLLLLSLALLPVLREERRRLGGGGRLLDGANAGAEEAPATTPPLFVAFTLILLLKLLLLLLLLLLLGALLWSISCVSIELLALAPPPAVAVTAADVTPALALLPYVLSTEVEETAPAPALLLSSGLGSTETKGDAKFISCASGGAGGT